MKTLATCLRSGLFALLPLAALAQTGVGVGTTTPDASAVLDISSGSQGVLLPRLTQAARLAMGTGTVPAPATGLLVYQTDGTAGFYYNAGTPAAPSWQLVAATASAAGQVLRFGFDASTYGTTETALRFGNNDSDAEMGQAPSGQANFFNTIAGASVADGVSLPAGTSTYARTTDQVSLPAGTYRVTVDLTGYYNATNAANGIGIKFIVNNAEQSFRFALNTAGTISGTAEVSELITLPAAGTLDFSISSFAAAFTAQNYDPVNAARSYRSVVLVERLR